MHVAVLITINLCTKLEVSSFVRSKDMTEATKCRNGSRDHNHTHLGDVSHHEANSSHGQLKDKI